MKTEEFTCSRNRTAVTYHIKPFILVIKIRYIDYQIGTRNTVHENQAV